MRVLIAFDKFKDAITAHQACRIAAETLQTRQPGYSIEIAPLADGGDGFCEVLTRQADGELHRLNVIGPQEEITEATFGIVTRYSIQKRACQLLNFTESVSRVAIIELAQSSGIALVPNEQRNPWNCTTAGLGQLIAAAHENAADAAIIGLGGSATHDLALGALQQLGYRFLDKSGKAMGHFPTPENWPSINSIVAPPSMPNLDVRIACDVNNPLLGLQGAATVFGPQKGLKAEDLDSLESETKRMGKLLCQCNEISFGSMDRPGAGAAGGAAFGLASGLGGQLVPGFELVDAWIGLGPKLERADVVITGEGRFDESSLQGKGPGSLVIEANRLGKTVYVFAGAIGGLESERFEKTSLHAITPPNTPIDLALRASESNLKRIVRDVFSENVEQYP